MIFTDSRSPSRPLLLDMFPYNRIFKNYANVCELAEIEVLYCDYKYTIIYHMVTLEVVLYI